MKTSQSREAPSTVEATLLSRLLDETLRSGGAVGASKFRSDNYSMIDALERLEQHGLIRRANNQYTIATAALPLIDSDAARRRISTAERLYAAIRERYRQTQEAPVTVRQLAADANLPASDAAAALEFMLENSLWWSGHSANLAKADAYVNPSEAVLKYPTFMSAVDEVEKWNRKTAEQGWPLPPFSDSSKFTDAPEHHARALVDPEDVSRPSRPKTSQMGKDVPLRGWPAARACLQEFSFSDIKALAGLAGFDVTTAAHLVQKPQGGATKDQLLSAIDREFGQMAADAQTRFLTIIIEEILRRKPASEEKLSEYFSRLGLAFVERTLVPIHVLDPRDLEELPAESHGDLLKAVQRLRDGDLSGAISGACGAVDSATAVVYQQKGLGDPTQASFQERCRKAVQAKGLVTELRHQLLALGWQEADVTPFQKNLEGSLNQGAFVMQTLRSHMGDVHGSKPILKPLVFDCLRWAELIVGSLVEPRDD